MNQEMRKIQQVAKGPRKQKIVGRKKGPRKFEPVSAKKMLRVTRGPLDARQK
jgi:hypothetical protein